MKALVLEAYNQFVYKDVPEPTINPDEVLIQVAACGICGSDVHGMDGSSGRRIPPIIMGHEASGTIAETGADVTGWQVGDCVTSDSTIYCGECYFCRKAVELFTVIYRSRRDGKPVQFPLDAELGADDFDGRLREPGTML